MSYQCDICTNQMPDKAHGTYFDQNRVLTSPSFWEHLYIKGTSFGKLDSEQMLGLFLTTFCKDDPNGYTVCRACREMLSSDYEKAKRFGIEKCATSIPSGRVDKPSVGLVAGVVWEKVYGSWPSSIKVKTEGQKDAIKPDKKWWQLWK